MINLGRCKTMYLESVLGLNRHSSNTFRLVLANETTRCVRDVKNLGFTFTLEFTFTRLHWTEYSENVVQKDSSLKIASRHEVQRPTAKNGSSRTERTDTPCHSPRIHVCVRRDFFEETNNLRINIYCNCNERAIDRYHITRCERFENKSIRRSVTEISENAKPCE